MAYNELVKNFNKIRDYMREFYVYGFKTRDEFDKKSARTYDDEKRRIESFLGEYMQFRQDKDGKTVFLSIDSRMISHNPFYKALKTKSFTDGDITLHFLIFDILSNKDIAYSISEITKKIDDILSNFDTPKLFDESTVRKKLNEYKKQGLIVSYKSGKTMYYKRSSDKEIYSSDCITFFSEVLPCGVVGSYLLDRLDEETDYISFKHHYITSAIDSEVLADIFIAIRDRKSIDAIIQQKNGDRLIKKDIVPLKVFISVQSGRQYVAIYMEGTKNMTFYRIDSLISIKIKDECKEFNKYNNLLENLRKNIWGVTLSGDLSKTEHVEFVVRYNDSEEFVHDRLKRECRIGTVTRIDKNTSKFEADVYSARELIPWIRTFIGRISEVSFSNKKIEEQFLQDMKDMYNMYGID